MPLVWLAAGTFGTTLAPSMPLARGYGPLMVYQVMGCNTLKRNEFSKLVPSWCQASGGRKTRVVIPTPGLMGMVRLGFTVGRAFGADPLGEPPNGFAETGEGASIRATQVLHPENLEGSNSRAVGCGAG